MKKSRLSAGVLLFRRVGMGAEVLLAHPGGPWWARKDESAWSIPKGEYDPDEDPQEAARRELREETGIEVDGLLVPLGSLTQPSGKVVTAWAVEQDWDPSLLRSNTFVMEWPPRSGKAKEFPEVDRAEWFSLEVASRKISKGQSGFIDRLAQVLGTSLGLRTDDMRTRE
jgi:predicted NUDIX family NTP pyrophosphohydrolase